MSRILTVFVIFIVPANNDRVFDKLIKLFDLVLLVKAKVLYALSRADTCLTHHVGNILMNISILKDHGKAKGQACRSVDSFRGKNRGVLEGSLMTTLSRLDKG